MSDLEQEILAILAKIAVERNVSPTLVREATQRVLAGDLWGYAELDFILEQTNRRYHERKATETDS